MKRHILALVWAMAAAVAWAPRADAQTVGSMTCLYTTVTQSGGEDPPKHYLAAWIYSDAGQFIKTIERRGNSSSYYRYLYKWRVDSASNAVVDGVTGSTIANHTKPHTNWWNGKLTDGTVAADGWYRLRIEYTQSNGQGPYSTNWVRFYKGTQAYTTNYANLPNILTSISLSYTPTVVSHDLAVTRIAAPAIGFLGSNVAVAVTVSNLMSTSESAILVTLSNRTSGVLVSNQTIASLGGNAATTLNFNWVPSGTTGTFTLEARATPVAGETTTGDNQKSTNVLVRTPVHELAARHAGLPGMIPPNRMTNLFMAVTNFGDFAETFAVSVTDVTAAAAVGARTLTNFPAGGVTNVAVPWNTTNAALGWHILAYRAGPVAGESNAANNVSTGQTIVASGIATNVLVARRSGWSYHDKGLDLHKGPWTSPTYYDGHWASGPGILGYGDPWVATTISYGSDTNNRYPCYYFRKSVFVAGEPLSLTLRLVCDDGAIVYINGAEVARQNMEPGVPPEYAMYATATVSGTAESNYTEIVLSPDAVQPGLNLIAAELHQSSSNSTDAGFDLELVDTEPQVARPHDVQVVSVAAAGSAVVGDELPVDVAVGNAGAFPETFGVTLTETNTGSEIGFLTASNLQPGASAVLPFKWATKTVTPGTYGVKATAATVAGETSTVDNAAIGQAVVSGDGMSAGGSPVVAGSVGGYCGAVAVADGRVYLGAGATLVVLGSGGTQALGQVRLGGLIEDLTVSNGVAYAACGAAGLQVVDVSVPAVPRVVRTFASSGHARGIATSPWMLMLADGPAGLRGFDLTDPLNPVLIESIPTTGPASDVADVEGPIAIADEYRGLVVLSGDPAGVVCPDSGLGVRLAAAGTRVLLADGLGALAVADVTDPGAPVLSGRCTLPAPPRDVAAYGNYACVAAGAAGLILVDVSSPSSPTASVTVALAGEATAVAVDGTRAYVAAGMGGLQIVDLATPTAPVLAGSYAQQARAHDAVQTNGFLIVAAGEAGLRVFSVTNPALPVLVASLATSNAQGVALSGGILAVADGPGGLQLVSVTNPAAPLLLGSYASTNLRFATRVALRGGTCLVSDRGSLHRFDVSNPAAPALQATYAGPLPILDLAQDATKAFAAAQRRVLCFDLSSPGQIILAATREVSGVASGVALVDNRLYAALAAGGWIVYDVSSVSSPVLLANHAVPVGAVAGQGPMVVLGKGVGASLVDASAPLTPVEQANFAPLVQVMKLTAGSRLAVAAEKEAGAALVSLDPMDIDGDLMNDAWEMQLVNASPSDGLRDLADIRPYDDLDGDGLANIYEFISRTDALNAQSFCALIAVDRASPSMALRWSSVPGKTYTVYVSTNLYDGFAPVATGIPATPPLNTWTVSVSEAHSCFMVEAQ